MSIKECQKILEKDSKKYTYDEVKEIRDLLYNLANIDYESFSKTKSEIDNTDEYKGMENPRIQEHL